MINNCNGLDYVYLKWVVMKTHSFHTCMSLMHIYVPSLISSVIPPRFLCFSYYVHYVLLVTALTFPKVANQEQLIKRHVARSLERKKVNRAIS